VAKAKRKGKTPPPRTSGVAPAQTPPKRKDRMREGYAKAEERNQAVRESLEPLDEGERPGAVTAGAIFSALIALIFWVSTIVAAVTDTTVDGNEPNPLSLAVFAFIMSTMAWGMWKGRYWAVLGFQMLLVLFLLAAAAGLVTAASVLQAVGTTLLIIVVGTFFYFMVKAMARIQMPTRDPR
jgi:hypothetical protein